jgi:hypothetical protein
MFGHPEGDHKEQPERQAEADTDGEADDEAASNPWHGVGGRGNESTVVSYDTQQPGA